MEVARKKEEVARKEAQFHELVSIMTMNRKRVMEKRTREIEEQKEQVAKKRKKEKEEKAKRRQLEDDEEAKMHQLEDDEVAKQLAEETEILLQEGQVLEEIKAQVFTLLRLKD